jgi:hypothetical protein
LPPRSMREAAGALTISTSMMFEFDFVLGLGAQEAATGESR